MFRTSQQYFRPSQDYEMREIRKTTYTAESDDIRQDDDERHQSLLKKDRFFIDPKQLGSLFSPQDYNKE